MRLLGGNGRPANDVQLIFSVQPLVAEIEQMNRVRGACECFVYAARGLGNRVPAPLRDGRSHASPWNWLPRITPCPGDANALFIPAAFGGVYYAALLAATNLNRILR